VVKHLGLSRSPQPKNTPIGWQGDELQLLQTAFAAFIALPAIFGPQDRGLIRGVLRARPVAYVGLISYGVYLYHEGLLEKLMVWTGRPNVTQLSGTVRLESSTFPLILVLTVLSSIAIATVSYCVVERPLLRRKDRVPRLFASRADRSVHA
jgi:peptidoglycan/LPS O-acetylase OafA/YrhL